MKFKHVTTIWSLRVASAVDRMVSDASVDEFDGLVLPGGTVNPDKLRLDELGGLVRPRLRRLRKAGRAPSAMVRGRWWKPVWRSGRTLTSYPSIRTDLRNAGAHVVDEEVVVDGNLITSRSPSDLPAFCSTILEQFAQAPTGSPHSADIPPFGLKHRFAGINTPSRDPRQLCRSRKACRDDHVPEPADHRFAEVYPAARRLPICSSTRCTRPD